MNFSANHKIRSSVFVAILLAALLAACSGAQTTPAQPQAAPTNPPPPTQAPKQAPTLVPSPAIPVPPALQPTPLNVAGGKTIKQGPFVFDLRIYRDLNLNKNPGASSQYSDLEGFGEYMTWVYNGPPLQGSVYEFWGTQPNITQLNSYGGLNTGDNGGRIGGIFLPGGSFLPGSSKPGDLIKLVLRMETPQGKYGASLTFNLKKTAAGFEPVNITVRVLGAD
jgi:hypothetical protein